MAGKMREMIVENLAVASALGFLALIVAALALVDDSRSVAAESGALAAPSATAIVASRVDDPAFDRIYEIKDASGLAFGTVLALRSQGGSALFGAVFTPQGKLRELRLLGSCASRLPSDAKEALGAFAGSEAALARAAEAVVSAAGGANAAPEADS
jgi:hypothetical protein